MFSITYVKYYQHKREKEFGSTMVTTLALTTVRCLCLTIYVCIIKNKKDIQGRWTLLACLYDEIYRPNVVSWHAVLLHVCHLLFYNRAVRVRARVYWCI